MIQIFQDLLGSYASFASDPSLLLPIVLLLPMLLALISGLFALVKQ